MDLVVNEWLPEYFRPSASDEQKKLLETFLNRFYTKGDTIFVRRPSEFARKIPRYAKDYQSDAKTYQNLNSFIKLIWIDSERTVLIDEMTETLPEATKQLLGIGNFGSDTYLFEAAIHTVSKIIITTDEKLAEQMKNDEVFKVKLLKDFLIDY